MDFCPVAVEALRLKFCSPHMNVDHPQDLNFNREFSKKILNILRYIVTDRKWLKFMSLKL